ncbi:hypothetical protein L3X38_006569 [Prunus dulcis]|uniref:Uncharacterized protein n=1 Tax=Prunus dulcis TaxID=3755 RepID=A0AAD5F5C1_PRUDU|nr:hypothetical protein L3X38_006569 [Prunus dulcis]
MPFQTHHEVPPNCFETVSFINNAPHVLGTPEPCGARNATHANQRSPEACEDCGSDRSGISEACEDCGSDISGISEACEDGIDGISGIDGCHTPDRLRRSRILSALGLATFSLARTVLFLGAHEATSQGGHSSWDCSSLQLA